MASPFNLKITVSQIYAIFLILISYEIFPVNSDTRQLTSKEIGLVGDLKELIQFYKKELDWELKDAIDGVIHWGIQDFANALLVKKFEVQATKPQCIVSTDKVRQEIISNSSHIKNCLHTLNHKLDAAKDVADRVSNVADLDLLVSQLVAYKGAKDIDITNCYKPSYMFAFNKHKEETEKIDMCVSVNRYT